MMRNKVETVPARYDVILAPPKVDPQLITAVYIGDRRLGFTAALALDKKERYHIIYEWRRSDFARWALEAGLDPKRKSFHGVYDKPAYAVVVRNWAQVLSMYGVAVVDHVSRFWLQRTKKVVMPDMPMVVLTDSGPQGTVPEATLRDRLYGNLAILSTEDRKQWMFILGRYKGSTSVGTALRSNRRNMTMMMQDYARSIADYREYFIRGGK